MDKKVSIIITTYGREYDIIKRSINSVINQTYKNIELIIVNDNGNNIQFNKDIENNIKKLKKIIEIKYIKNKENTGAQHSRNEGISNASGELIAFLDDDDEWLPLKIEKQVEQFCSEDIGLVYTDGYTITEETLTKNNYHSNYEFKEKTSFIEMLCSDVIGTTTTGMVSKKAFETVGNFDIDQPARQDYEMWLRILTKFKCVGINEKLFNHYIHKGEQISKNVDKSIVGYLNIYHKYYYYYKKHPKAKYDFYKKMILCYKRKKDYMNVIKYIFMKFAILPLATIEYLKQKQRKESVDNE